MSSFFYSLGIPVGGHHVEGENWNLNQIRMAFSTILRVQNGVLLPVSVAIHRQDPDDRPRQVSALDEERNFVQESGGTYNVATRHLAVYVRNIRSVMEFRSDYATQNFHIRMIRTMFFEDLDIDLTILRRVLAEFPYLQMIHFRNVRFDMSSWGNIMDQVAVFNRNTRRRIVNFVNCVFLEDIGVVRIRGTARLMANRVPIYFYRYLVMQGYLVHFDQSTSKYFFNFFQTLFLEINFK